MTRLLPADAGGIAEAARLLTGGGLVALPTETVYGLGADATNGKAVAGIYAAKGRPRFNPLIAHVADIAAARAIAAFDARAERLTAAFWPGPLTLVLPQAPGNGLSELVTAGLASVAVRMPSHPVARALIAAAGCPVAAPSANRSGHVSPTAADHVMADLAGRIDAVLDGGPTEVGVESTIVALLAGPARLLRPGGLAREAIEAVLGAPLENALPDDGAPLAPGMLTSHYAPEAKVRLDAVEVRPGEALLAFGAERLPGAEPVAVFNLSQTSDLAEAASRLFLGLRVLDGSAPVIAVAKIPGHGLGEAIRDRLGRAAAER